MEDLIKKLEEQISYFKGGEGYDPDFILMHEDTWLELSSYFNHKLNYKGTKIYRSFDISRNVFLIG